jgi:erythromycin esterase-like protein
MRIRTTTILFSLFAGLTVDACRSAPKLPPPPPPPLSDTAAAALRWVETHRTLFSGTDSVASPAERSFLTSLANNAQIVGFSELNEGTHEFAYIVRRALFALADSSRVRGLAIQAPMAEAMEIDRYVRGGSGDLGRLLRPMGSWRWETREMRALVDAIRAHNAGRAPGDQIGFYGFEIPSARHAVDVIVDSLPEAITGAPLKAWLRRTYSCVAINEGAQWGREGRTADSLYWRSCGPAAVAALDSVSALRRRVGATAAAAPMLVYAERMAKVVEHHVRIGLRRLKREEFNMEHVLFLADLVGAGNKLMLWGADVEMARLTLDGTTVQTAVPLAAKLGDKYRNIVFTYGEGVVRTRSLANVPRAGGEIGLSNVAVVRPHTDMYEDVLGRASGDGYWLDMRALPADAGGKWLGGPRPMRFITESYSALSPENFQTPIEFPKNFDAIVFVKTVTPPR